MLYRISQIGSCEPCSFSTLDSPVIHPGFPDALKEGAAGVKPYRPRLFDDA